MLIKKKEVMENVEFDNNIVLLISIFIQMSQTRDTLVAISVYV